MSKLSLAFLEFAKGRADLPASGEELEHMLECAVATGHQGRPFTLEAELFVSYLAQRLPAASKEVPLVQVLEKMHLRDLYLKCACVHGVPEALEELEEVHLSELRIWLKRTSAVVEEVCQNVRDVVASRLLPPKDQPSPAGDLSQELESLIFPGPDPEAEFNEPHVVHAFRQAVRDALAVLSKEQRLLLRYRYVHRLGTAALGQMLGVTQSTASRRLTAARERVREETLRLVQERLKLSSVDLDNLLGESDEGGE